MVIVGGNQFIDCVVPVMCGDRAFIVQEGYQRPVFSVVRVVDGQPVFEVLQNRPVDNDYTKASRTTPGIITVTEAGTGRFLYKIRPGSETSIVFGTFGSSAPDGSLEVQMSDTAITVWRTEDSGKRTKMVTVRTSEVRGGVGVLITEAGSFALGAPVPPAIAGLFAQST